MTATLTAGDAIGNYSRMLQRILWRNGFSVRLYADLWDEHSRCLHSREFPNRVREGDILWYHYSIYSDNVRYIQQNSVYTILDYHGITPPELFTGYSSHLEKLCVMARKLIPFLAESVNLAMAHSDYTRDELIELGFNNIVKNPLAIDDALFTAPEHKKLTALLSSIEYLLFVGRITPQKSILELVDAFFTLSQKRPERIQLFQRVCVRDQGKNSAIGFSETGALHG